MRIETISGKTLEEYKQRVGLTETMVDQSLECLKEVIEECLANPGCGGTNRMAQIILSFHSESLYCNLWDMAGLSGKNKDRMLRVIMLLGSAQGGYQEPGRWLKDPSIMYTFYDLYAMMMNRVRRKTYK